MAIFALSITFEVKADGSTEADELATRISDLVIAEDLATSATVVDIELLEDEDEKEAEYEDDDE